MNARRRALGLFLGLAVALGTGCGDDERNDAVLVCDAVAFAPCGGDVDGLYHATSSCVLGDESITLSRSCGTIDVAFEVGVTGRLDFADGQTLSSARVRERYRATLSQACMAELFADSGVARCEDATPPAPLDVCVTRGDTCLCSMTRILTYGSDELRPTDEATLGVIPADDPVRSLRYCSEGDFLDVELSSVDLAGIERRVVTRWAR